jgi:hypothetical protein
MTYVSTLIMAQHLHDTRCIRAQVDSKAMRKATSRLEAVEKELQRHPLAALGALASIIVILEQFLSVHGWLHTLSINCCVVQERYAARSFGWNACRGVMFQ